MYSVQPECAQLALQLGVLLADGDVASQPLGQPNSASTSTSSMCVWCASEGIGATCDLAHEAQMRRMRTHRSPLFSRIGSSESAESGESCWQDVPPDTNSARSGPLRSFANFSFERVDCTRPESGFRIKCFRKKYNILS